MLAQITNGQAFETEPANVVTGFDYRPSRQVLPENLAKRRKENSIGKRRQSYGGEVPAETEPHKGDSWGWQ